MPEVKDCCHLVVNAAIAVYYKMCNAMLPTPRKSHYTFNLRDLSAVIKGVLQVNNVRFVFVYIVFFSSCGRLCYFSCFN